MFVLRNVEEFSVEVLCDFLAERVSKTARIVVLSVEPEALMQSFKKAWRVAYARLMAERDAERDIMYMSTLTEIVATMQQTKIAYSEGSFDQELIFAHPYEISAGIWVDRHLIVCCDELSARASAKLLAFAQSRCRLLVYWGEVLPELIKPVEDYESLREAKSLYRQLLLDQISVCAQLGIDLTGHIGAVMVHSQVLGLLYSPQNNTILLDKLRENQVELAQLRTIIGRAKTIKGVTYNQLKNLKVLTRYITEDTSADNQLFDDPVGHHWRKV